MLFGSKEMWFTAIKKAPAKVWRKIVAAEDPDERGDRIRQQHIDEFTLFADLLNAMRAWEKERCRTHGGMQPV
jgi:hypothetical protein